MTQDAPRPAVNPWIVAVAVMFVTFTKVLAPRW